MTILYAAIISHFDLFFNPVFARFSAAVKSESAAKPRGRTGRSRRDLRSGMRAGHTRGGVPPERERVCLRLYGRRAAVFFQRKRARICILDVLHIKESAAFPRAGVRICLSGGRVGNSAVRVPEQPFARARLALCVKIYCSPADALAIRAAGRQSSPSVRAVCIKRISPRRKPRGAG